ncbi:hypothetical protein BJ742DRAFT_733739 [Cladochytrium replicatum]|nr:hypothetical protein BJ742DRAFT_733739 [Cladochytrium replicatum]
MDDFASSNFKDPFGRFGHELYGFAEADVYSSEQREYHHPLGPNVNRLLAKSTAGYELNLIVGRGTNASSWWTGGHTAKSAITSPSMEAIIADKTEPVRWVPVDRFGGVFPRRDHIAGSPPPLHIWMDFNRPEALSQLPDECISQVCIDWSTWRYMTPCARSISSHWSRILKPGGSICFECGISSVRYVQKNDEAGLCWDFENPTHATVSVDQVDSMLIRAAADIVGNAESNTQRSTHSVSTPVDNALNHSKRLPVSPLDRVRLLERKQKQNQPLLQPVHGYDDRNGSKTRFSIPPVAFNVRRVIKAADANRWASASSVVDVLSEHVLTAAASEGPSAIELSSHDLDAIVAFYMAPLVANQYREHFLRSHGNGGKWTDLVVFPQIPQMALRRLRSSTSTAFKDPVSVSFSPTGYNPSSAVKTLSTTTATFAESKHLYQQQIHADIAHLRKVQHTYETTLPQHNMLLGVVLVDVNISDSPGKTVELSENGSSWTVLAKVSKTSLEG